MSATSGSKDISASTRSTDTNGAMARRRMRCDRSSKSNSAQFVTTTQGPVPRGNPTRSRAPGDPSRKPGDEMKSTLGTNFRFW